MVEVRYEPRTLFSIHTDLARWREQIQPERPGDEDGHLVSVDVVSGTVERPPTTLRYPLGGDAKNRESSRAGTHPSDKTTARHMPGRRSSFLGADTSRRRQPSSSLFLRVRVVKAEGLGEEYRHLDAGQGAVGAEIAAATTGGDPRGHQSLDVLETKGADRHIAKGRGPRRG